MERQKRLKLFHRYCFADTLHLLLDSAGTRRVVVVAELPNYLCTIMLLKQLVPTTVTAKSCKLVQKCLFAMSDLNSIKITRELAYLARF